MTEHKDSGEQGNKSTGNHNDGNSKKDGDGISIPSEILESIPKEDRPKVIREMSTTIASFMGRLPNPNPLAAKINESHIDKILDNVENDDKRQAEAAKSTRRYIFAGFCVILAVALALVIFLSLNQQTGILVDLIIALFSFAGGFGVGKYFQHK
jgi:hypothetical protein